MTTNCTYQLYEPRRTEHALCCDFPADEVLIRGLHTLEKYWWNKGWQASLSAVRVMNAVHYVVTYMLNMPTRTQSEYDQMLYDYVGQDRMLMRAAMLALPEMLRRIALPQARSYRALMMEDRSEEFYEGVSLYQQWLEGAEEYYREEDFLIDVMDEVNILRMKYNNALNEIAKMEKEMNEQKQGTPIVYGNYIASQTINNDIHDNNNCNIYACPTKGGEQVEQKDRVVEDAPIAGEAEDLFMYIHHDVVDEAERLKVHKKIKNIVRLPKVQLICENLKTLMNSGEVYKTIKPDSMLKELRRIGMPDESVDGFSDGNFFTYYKNIF